ncbi:MAG: hypothetical protein K9N10_22840 [Deltaproteobacteria bacterium]|nr:hypothetical protein [Deltaproteobacteria bacterium]
MRRLHLIERMGLQQPWEPGDSEYTRTGYWAFSEEQADEFIGCFLFLHKGQAEPAHYAGEVVGVHQQPDGKYAGRFVFKVRNEPRLLGLSTSRDGWAMWWKAE